MTVAPKLGGALPLVGHLAGMRRDPLATLLRAARLGDSVRLDFGPRGNPLLVTHPDGIKHVFLDAQPNYTKQTRGFDMLRIFLGNGLLTSEGDFWRKQRRIAQPAFHRGSIERFARVMVRATEDLARRWEERAAAHQVFDVADDMMRLTLRIVGECLFSTDPSDESSAIGPQVDVLLREFISRIFAPASLPLSWPLPGNRRVRNAIVVMHTIVDDIVARRRATGPTADGDLLDMLMSAEDAETGERMSAAQLRDEVLTLLLAGHETTAAALAWTWTLLAAHPGVDRALEGELRALGAPSIGLAELPRVPLVEQVIHEALRLYPPAWIIARTVAEDDEIGGVPVARGSLVIVSPYVTHRRPDLFAEPAAFRPDRFRTGDGPVGGFSRYAYLPFGAGPRICIGNGFALMEARLALATLRRRFRLELAPGARIAPLPQLTLRCRYGVPVVAHRVD